MLRTILGAILGYCFIGLLIMVTDKAYALAIPGMSPLRVLPDWYYVLAMLTDTIYTFAGGSLCAVISRRDSQATIGLIILGEVMGIASTIYLWNTAPHYYSFYLLIAYPPAVWYGAKLRTPVQA